MKKTFSTFIALSLISTQAYAEQPKGTDIYLTSFEIKDNKYTFSEPINFTNREGYDNQPSFSPDGKEILYVSQRNNQTDVYKYDLERKEIYQVTNTPESEYSPIITPDEDKISVVRVEDDGTQRLWSFNCEGQNPKVLINSIVPVGYYGWISNDLVGMFVLGEHSSLQLFNFKTGQHDIVLADVGRSIKKIPNTNSFAFSDTKNKTKQIINKLDINTMKTTKITNALEGSEDFTFSPDGKLYMAQKSKLFVYDLNKDKKWNQIADFSKYGVKNIFRLSINPNNNKLAFVSEY